MKLEMETVREIWNDMDKSYIQIGPDRNGFGCVEIRYVNENGVIKDRMTFPPEMARLVSVTMVKCAEEIEENI